MPPVIVRPDELDFAEFVRPGDTVVWGQTCAEPVTLTEELMRQRHQVAPIRCFVGIPVTRTLRPEFADAISFVSYCGSGSNRRMLRAGAMDVAPVHYSTLPTLLTEGPLRADVVLVQVSAPDEQGRYSLGIGDDYYSATIDTARVVIAEVNDQVPQTRCTRWLTDDDLDVVVPTSRPPAESATPAPSPVMQQVAANAAALIDDGATLQFGIGALPAAVLAQLADRRDLGVHSGQLNDAAADLMDAGVITNARKSIDRGVSVAGMLMGTRRVFAFAHRNPAVQLRDSGYTHDASVLAAHDRFVAINSAVEVDLSGQVNAEVAAGDYVGAVGGAVDFLRGAARSKGGLPLVVLPSTAGGASRIVPSVSGPVSTARADAGVVVTEYGVADLRGQPLRARYERMLAIAHPDHRTALAEAAEDSLRRSGVLV